MSLPIQVTMLLMRAMFVVMLMLDCLVCVYGVRVEDRSEYRACIANPAGCTSLYVARPPSPLAACATAAKPLSAVTPFFDWAHRL